MCRQMPHVIGEVYAAKQHTHSLPAAEGFRDLCSKLRPHFIFRRAGRLRQARHSGGCCDYSHEQQRHSNSPYHQQSALDINCRRGFWLVLHKGSLWLQGDRHQSHANAWFRQDRQLQIRHKGRHQGQQNGAHDRGEPHGMPCRRGCAAKENGCGGSGHQDNARLGYDIQGETHLLPPLRALSISFCKRSNSGSDSFDDLESSSAATASSADPSKNVRTR